MEKVCTGCKVLKNFDEFGNVRKAFDGKNQKCKACCKARAKKTVHSAEAIANKKAYQAEWQRKKAPILNAKARKSYKENIEKCREQAKIRQKRYMQTEKGKATHLAASKRWKEENYEKYSAHQKVKKAIKSGKLIRPDNCEVCEKEGKIEAHHEDYTKPLDVIWMCQYCHLYHHQRSRFHADRLSEKTSKEDAIVRSGKETTRGNSEEGSPLSKDSQ